MFYDNCDILSKLIKYKCNFASLIFKIFFHDANSIIKIHKSFAQMTIKYVTFA